MFFDVTLKTSPFKVSKCHIGVYQQY